MNTEHGGRNLAEIQSAIDHLIDTDSDARRDAFSDLCLAILDHFGHPADSNLSQSLFSNELPERIQRFTAAWLLRALTRSATCLDFDGTQLQTGLLFDRTLHQDVYPQLNIDAGTQTFEKLRALAAYAQNVLESFDNLLSTVPNLDRIPRLQQRFQQILNTKQNQPFLGPLLPSPLADRERVSNLFRTISDYANDTERDLLHKRDAAFTACAEFEQEALNYGTTDAENILGRLAKGLESAVGRHFDSLEASTASGYF